MPSSRRQFLKTTFATIAGGAAAPLWMPNIAASVTQEPLQVGATPVFKLGLAAYSFKPHFEFMKGKPQKPLDGKVDRYV